MPLISSLALAPILLKTGSASLAATGATTASFAAGSTAAVGGGAAAAGGKVLGLAMLTKGVSSAAKSGAFTKTGAAAAAGTAATHAAATQAAATHAAAAHAAAAPGLVAAGGGAPAGAVLAGPAVVAAPAIVAAGAPAVAAAAPALVPATTAAGVAAAGEVAAAPAGGGRHFTMIATVVGVMVLRALANRYWLNKPAEAKSRLVRRVCRWSKEEEVAVEAEEEFGQIPQLPFKDECRNYYVEAGTGAPNPRRLTKEEESRISAARATDAGLTDIETTASTQETRRRRVSYVRRTKGKLHRFL
ncbi:hypothetical protein Emed_006170 [Eimeria media]